MKILGPWINIDNWHLREGEFPLQLEINELYNDDIEFCKVKVDCRLKNRGYTLIDNIEEWGKYKVLL